MRFRADARKRATPVRTFALVHREHEPTGLPRIVRLGRPTAHGSVFLAAVRGPRAVAPSEVAGVCHRFGEFRIRGVYGRMSEYRGISVGEVLGDLPTSTPKHRFEP